MYWDLLKVDLFQHQIRSNKRLVSFAAITVSSTHPGMYFALVIFGVWWCMFINMSGQGSVHRECRLPWMDY